jgi:ribosomal protein S18 acetylase RimI-like enzyme
VEVDVEVQRDRQRTRSVGVTWLRRIDPYRPTDVERGVAEAILEDTEADLISLHLAALLVSAESRDDTALGLELIEHMERLDRTHLTGYLLLILRRAVASGSPEVVQRAFRQLVEFEEPSHYHTTLESFIERDPDVLVGVDAVELDLTQDALAAFVDEVERRCSPPQDSDESSAIARNLLMFLAEYGASHPSRYRQLRAVLTRLSVMNASSAVGDQAAQARLRVERGFREWIGRSSRVAVDPETGLEYRWDDVVAFSEEVDAEARRRLRDAIANTPMLREGMFLFSGGSVVRLEDILPGGVWIRLLGSDHGKSVYRIVVKTRQHEQLDLAVNLNTGLTPEQIREEIDWLIVCSEARELGPLVEEFGGYWPEHSMWTEEFIPGDTLDRALSRLARRDPDGDWYLNIWPFAAWSALGAYVDFWNRTGRTLVVADPGPSNVIVPMHDYYTGARLVSISARLDFQSLGGLLTTLQEQLIAAIEAEHPRLQGQVGWNVVFASLLEIVGEAEGVALLRPLLDSGAESVRPDMKDTLVDFLEAVERRGFLPRRLYFSAKRYRRWESLNPEATRSARARTLQELFHTYRLHDIRSTYPDVRPRFYLGTVFRDAPQPLARGLQEIVVALRRGELSPDDLSAVVSDLRARLILDDEADYFLARLSYPYLRPDDVAEYVGTDAGGEHQSEMVVTLEDSDGRPYRIRHAISPKEVARLHRLFLEAKLSVQFRPEHRFLVAVNLRGHLVGGLFYELLPEEHTAHMDKLVVAEAFRGHGIAGAMLDELCNRLRTSGYRSLTTGFFRPQFFYRYGFSVERRYAGLVRTLIDQEDET